VVVNQPPAWFVAGLGLPVAALVVSFLVYALREDPPRDPEELP